MGRVGAFQIFPEWWKEQDSDVLYLPSETHSPPQHTHTYLLPLLLLGEHRESEAHQRGSFQPYMLAEALLLF